MNVPLSPPSIAAPPSALSTQWATNIVRTPSAYIRAMPRSMSSRSHCGCPLSRRQPNGSEDSTPMSTASLPARIALRAAVGVVTSRNQPRPRPPLRGGGGGAAPHPAAPAPAALRVDVVLERAQALDLELDRVGLVAGVRAQRLDLAQRRILDRLRDDQTLARQPGALEPAVVDLLVGVGVEGGPARERRPAVDVVRARGAARAQEVAGDVEAAVGAVGLLVAPQRLGDPEGVEVRAGDDVAAGAQVGGHMHVRVGEADDRAAP